MLRPRRLRRLFILLKTQPRTCSNLCSSGQQHQQQDFLQIMTFHIAYTDENRFIHNHPHPLFELPSSSFPLDKTISHSYDLQTIYKHCASIRGFWTTEELLELFARNKKGSKEKILPINWILIAKWREFDALQAHVKSRKMRFPVLMSSRILKSLKVGDSLVKTCSKTAIATKMLLFKAFQQGFFWVYQTKWAGFTI